MKWISVKSYWRNIQGKNFQNYPQTHLFKKNSFKQKKQIDYYISFNVLLNIQVILKYNGKLNRLYLSYNTWAYNLNYHCKLSNA